MLGANGVPHVIERRDIGAALLRRDLAEGECREEESNGENGEAAQSDNRTTIVSVMAKTALVTGASTGIGYEFSRLLARDGYRLFLIARNAEKLKQVAGELQQAGSPSVIVLAEDLASPEAPARIFEALDGATPDVLINNAGFGFLGAFDRSDLKMDLEMIQVNVAALVELTHRFLPGMLQRGSGRILNVASTAAFQPGPLMAIYFATKSFVLHFSEAVAYEVKGTGVTVTALCPGATNTEFQGRAKMTETKLFKSGSVMTAAAVARIGYAAMKKGKILSIAGFSNRLLLQGLRLAPRSVVRKMVYLLQKS